MEVAFTVHGTPQPKGSKRAFIMKGKKGKKPRASLAEANEKAKPWMQQVSQAAGEAMGDRDLIDGPVELSVVAYMPRPKGHYRTGRFAGQAKPSAPLLHTTRPDLFKLVRGIEDALTGVIYRDDSQIAHARATKLYTCGGAHALVCVRAMDDSEGGLRSSEPVQGS
ncbi:MAG: RusA family crossover junction endodeoxyribonuclease [Myxococcales bacterium FL481]|nr:MAG: RusA family crossover junction endodeoxyribonuclease [Myxococcales bacterium FL481]